MGKIRVQDLARMMGISNQDLVFKLKSIGVRVEGDDANIDTDIIQAILQGKKLPHPREVILRDETAVPEAPRRRTPPPAARRPAASPLRPNRPRTMIQKVDQRIQTLPSSEPSAQPPAPEAPPPETQAPAAFEAEPQAPEPQAPAAQAPAAQAPAPPAEPAAAPPPAAAGRPEAAPPPPAPTRAPERPAERPGAPAGPRRDAGVGARPGPRDNRSPAGRAPAASRPPTGRPMRPTSAPPSTEELKRRAEQRMQEQQEREKKKKKGAKRPVGPRALEEDLTSFRGTVEEIEEGPTRVPATGRRRRRVERRQEEGGKVLSFKTAPPAGPVMISEGMTLREFAEKLGVKVKDLMKALFKRGILANINQVIDSDLAQKLAEDLGVEAMVVSFEEEVQLREELEAGTEAPEAKEARAPVVTIMGHVDHGKTSLLDRIRSARVAESEFGGITQHIGAYEVKVNDRKVVFLDTPGHEAFTMMRARGSKVTDLVVLVVAADDGVMPQTIEAIDHARAAKVPIIVAVNKIDKANANTDRVKKELADRGLIPEDWGGDTVMVHVSALKGDGIPELLEMITLNADILELKASPEISAQGAVLEARKDVGRGIVATVLVQNGTLRVGDVFVSGATWGRVRSMADDLGHRIKEAGPSTPVEVTGLNDLPAAGDLFQVLADEQQARAIAEYRAEEQRKRGLAPVQQRLSLEQLFDKIQEGEVKDLPVVLKADVQGSVEVLRDALGKASTEKVRVQALHTGVGAITTNDVLLASASKAIIIGFNVRPERGAADLAEKEGVDIRLHTVIYELIDELRKAMTGLLEPTFREVSTGRAEVRDTFKVPKAGTVAGCHVVEGTIPRSALVRLLRDNRVVWEGKIASLRRFKDDVSEVRAGFDCGIGLERFQDVKPGDAIEAYVREEVAPVL